MNPSEKIRVLIEALPCFKKYDNKIVIIKIGGNALAEMNNAVDDVVLLKRFGIKPIIVHGGGPEIDKELRKLKVESKFIDGLRYTDEIVIKVVEKVFNKINKKIVNKLKAQGVKSTSAGSCIEVKQKSPQLGLVGEIKKVKKNILFKLLSSGFIPVVSPLGIGKGGRKYNINADTAASHIAVALKAEKLTILTNVDGVIINRKLLSHLDFKAAKKEIKQGAISKGMIPKVEACVYAVKNNCQKAHLINGLVPHSLLLEIFTDKGVGTEIVYKNEHK